mmetsp:Transcript_14647/g.44257  ORF Transcript_14647/g.44257 Transcript_14647/m.44257 type:complete len:121 (+) Transcript_14647:587-949(+)|eukprot:CAMPEP_0206136806 /NCGR_PEP_ID=MMETSP1473-20131121/2030_1 /ASSEMBLY_ACC=CAM_ASM_001109 /TAXON_ID=1461547 /ORGANISM="Stichococcus sp, Strain RCC1054" /LENGTH=120 /DNA_ID=CAMNT_0053529591 /DNA_START=265 /DNA_END=627 /DNA_ORIENTATION=+
MPPLWCSATAPTPPAGSVAGAVAGAGAVAVTGAPGQGETPESCRQGLLVEDGGQLGPLPFELRFPCPLPRCLLFTTCQPSEVCAVELTCEASASGGKAAGVNVLAASLHLSSGRLQPLPS